MCHKTLEGAWQAEGEASRVEGHPGLPSKTMPRVHTWIINYILSIPYFYTHIQGELRNMCHKTHP